MDSGPDSDRLIQRLADVLFLITSECNDNYSSLPLEAPEDQRRRAGLYFHLQVLRACRLTPIQNCS